MRVPPDPRADVVPDPQGFIGTGVGGLSVTPDDPTGMNPLRKPRALGGIGKDPLFVLDSDRLGVGLRFRRDPDEPRAHAFVEPTDRVPLAAYQRELHATRPSWSLA